ncbi:MAG: response regulator [Roseiarcus sp.]|jgi:chemotaxis family two-component system response regulator Rcp1
MIDDSPGDVRLTREAFRESSVDVELHVAEDGVSGMRFLRREGVDADAPRPDLILLDLNLPKKDGREVLAEIKNDPDLMVIPTVILSTSDSEADITRSYQLHANCYLGKPLEFEQYAQIIKQINDFWLQKATLTRNGARP